MVDDVKRAGYLAGNLRGRLVIFFLYLLGQLDISGLEISQFIVGPKGPIIYKI